MTVIGPLQSAFIGPTSPLVSLSGFAGLDVTSDRARPLRPISFASGLEYAAPAARVRIRTDSPTVTFHLSRNGLMNNLLFNDICSVFVDGELYQDYDLAGGSVSIAVEFEEVQCRTVELLYPYADGYDFLGITHDPRYPTYPFLERRRLLAAGDSITQGAYATSARLTWANLLAEARNMELFNMGYSGGIASTLGDGSWAAALNPDVIVVLLGHNDFFNQTPLVAYKAAMNILLTTWLAQTGAALYVVTPLWTNGSGTVPISSYRTALSEVVAAIDNPRIALVDGLSLAANSTAAFPDGVHPNDAGSESIASSLAALIS